MVPDQSRSRAGGPMVIWPPPRAWVPGPGGLTGQGLDRAGRGFYGVNKGVPGWADVPWVPGWVGLDKNSAAGNRPPSSAC